MSRLFDLIVRVVLFVLLVSVNAISLICSFIGYFYMSVFNKDKLEAMKRLVYECDNEIRTLVGHYAVRHHVLGSITVPVWHANGETNASCGILAPNIPSAACGLDKQGKYVVVVNDACIRDKHVFHASIQHECGHIAHGHLDKTHSYIVTLLRRTSVSKAALQQELEADAYAQAQGEDMLGVLHTLLSVIPSRTSARELTKRIHALEGRAP